jgi:chlorobactene glucosyltransferase
MPTIVVVLFVAWSGIIAILVGLLAAQFVALRRGVLLRPCTADHPPRDAKVWPAVCVVIPARNEAKEIGRCLDGVLAQDYPNLSVLVVDDRSEDDTAAIVNRYAQRDGRLRLEGVTSLPPGWLGKSHALWQGTRTVTADWILFLDADCHLEPHAVRSVIAEALRRKVELLSLWPRQAAGSFWEHMLIPLCAGSLAIWFRPDQVNRDGGESAFANGAFLLLNRSAYERIGGHRQVRTALIEDIPLAELAKREGVPCWVGSGRDIVSVRMYQSYRAIWDGWARIFVGAFRSGMKIAAGIAWLALGSLLPFLAAPALIADYVIAPSGARSAAAEEFRHIATGFCAVQLFLVFAVTYSFWGFGRSPRKYLWLYPMSVVVVIGILARAWWWLIVERSIPWRDRRYPIDRRGVITPPSPIAAEEGGLSYASEERGRMGVTTPTAPSAGTD